LFTKELFTYCKYVLFVHTIPKVPTEISFGIGMVNTKKYRPIPTGKYRFGIQLYIPRCYQQFFWYRYFAGIRFTWQSVFPAVLLILQEFLFSAKGGLAVSKRGPVPPLFLKKGVIAPFLREKGVPAKKMIPQCTDRDFLHTTENLPGRATTGILFFVAHCIIRLTEVCELVPNGFFFSSLLSPEVTTVSSSIGISLRLGYTTTRGIYLSSREISRYSPLHYSYCKALHKLGKNFGQNDY
jgi:hypothetical protein